MTEPLVFRDLDAVRARVGSELGISDWFEITQPVIDAFADLTRDHEWIHVDVERAATGPFGGTIAHGFLTLSLVPGFAAEIYRFELDRATVNYGLDKVRFMAPVPCGSRVRGRVVLEAADPHPSGTAILLHYTVELDDEATTAVCFAVSRLLLLA